MTQEEALKKLEEEFPQEKDVWELAIQMGTSPEQALEQMESFF